jgi:hypothetical protein
MLTIDVAVETQRPSTLSVCLEQLPLHFLETKSTITFQKTTKNNEGQLRTKHL